MCQYCKKLIKEQLRNDIYRNNVKLNLKLNECVLFTDCSQEQKERRVQEGNYTAHEYTRDLF